MELNFRGYDPLPAKWVPVDWVISQQRRARVWSCVALIGWGLFLAAVFVAPPAHWGLIVKGFFA